MVGSWNMEWDTWCAHPDPWKVSCAVQKICILYASNEKKKQKQNHFLYADIKH